MVAPYAPPYSMVLVGGDFQCTGGEGRRWRVAVRGDGGGGERARKERPKSVIVLGKGAEEKTMSKTRKVFRRFCKLL